MPNTHVPATSEAMPGEGQKSRRGFLRQFCGQPMAVAKSVAAKIYAVFSRPDAPPPFPFQPGSNILYDLHAAVLSANTRIEKGQDIEFGSALLGVLNDRKALLPNSGGRPSDKALYDWNWRRADRARAMAQSDDDQ